MSKTLSFKGIIASGLEDKLRLATIKGKTGYRITRFDVMDDHPGSTNEEWVVKIYSKSQTAGATGSVDFTEGDMLGVAYLENNSSHNYAEGTKIIFDNQIFNQDIFVTAIDNVGGSGFCNYYIELETMELSDLQSTQLTLKNLRNIASRQ